MAREGGGRAGVEEVTAPDPAGNAPGPPDRAGRRPLDAVRARLPAGLLFSLTVYLASRIPVVGLVILYLSRTPSKSVSTLVDERDGWWYRTIAEHGYPASLRQPVTALGDTHHAYSAWAFFPGYPAVIRAVHELTRMPYVAAALTVAGVCGFLAVWAVYALGRAHGGERVGRLAAVLVAVSPGSASFTWPYSDGLFIAAVAAALVCLHRRRWWLASACGFVATVTRPTGLAFVAAAAVVAVVELVRRRDPRPLVAPVLAALGAVGFALYGASVTGDPLVWRHAENLWKQHLDFGRDLRRLALPLLRDPTLAWQTHDDRIYLIMSLLDILGAALLLAMLAAAVVLALRRRLTTAMVVYAAVATFTIVGYSAVASRPRMVLAVVPGFVWLASALPRRATIALAVISVPFMLVTTWAWLEGVTP
jgi:hypothetical protein